MLFDLNGFLNGALVIEVKNSLICTCHSRYPKRAKRGLCSVEAMKRAIKAVEEGNRLRGAARMFNVAVETL